MYADKLKRFYDTLIVGAGPVGALSAIAFARRGQRVALCEANPRAHQRFAGEWLHPPALDVLSSLHIDLGQIEGGFALMRGFAVFPDDGSEPILLDYPNERRGIACEHSALVEALRHHAASRPEVDYVEGARVTELASTGIVGRLPCGEAFTTRAKGIIGADGRNSQVRNARIEDSAGETVSHSAGLAIADLTLPFEGYGHVVLGGPGPLLLYRINDRTVRASFDVPVGTSNERRDAHYLWRHFGPVLPAFLRAPIRRALREQRIQWAACRFRTRASYGVDDVALAGDAVGYFPPLTASGMTVGFLDVAALATSQGLDAYRRQRETHGWIAELLANALYQVFTDRRQSAAELRQAVFRTWRNDPAQRQRTLRVLVGEAPSASLFSHAFAHVGLSALREASSDCATALQALRRFAPWSVWPLAGLAPAKLRFHLRRDARAKTPLPALTDALTRTLRPLDPQTSGGAVETRSTTHPSTKPLTIDAHRHYCQEALEAVSRSFALPIAMLPDPLRDAVTCGYLLCRVADTIEDHPCLTLEARRGLFAQWLNVLRGHLEPEELAASFPQCELDDDELALCRDLPRVFALLDTLEEGYRSPILDWTAEMTRGMELYVERPVDEEGFHSLTTPADLRRYCYFVAGTVGHMLTDLFTHHCAVTGVALSAAQRRVLLENAERFGAGLQLVNILKDITDDAARGWCFVPRTTAAQLALTPAELTQPGKGERAHAAVAPLFDDAQAQLESALRYTIALPEAQQGIRLFCLLPVWMAAATLRLARGNDAIFDEDQSVKISRAQVDELVQQCVAIAGSNAAIEGAFRNLWQPEHAREVRA